ncbi:MAG TPA: ferredoxin [Acidimicrobiales bacterium]|nr:ferredoxin [Acidimicrobiales bacterium]
MATRLRVDPIACQAFGYCAELLPERIAVDEWGYPLLDGRGLPEELLELARSAARACPRRALTLVESPAR